MKRETRKISESSGEGVKIYLLMIKPMTIVIEWWAVLTVNDGREIGSRTVHGVRAGRWMLVVIVCIRTNCAIIRNIWTNTRHVEGELIKVLMNFVEWFMRVAFERHMAHKAAKLW